MTVHVQIFPGALERPTATAYTADGEERVALQLYGVQIHPGTRADALALLDAWRDAVLALPEEDSDG